MRVYTLAILTYIIRFMMKHKFNDYGRIKLKLLTGAYVVYTLVYLFPVISYE